MLQLGLEDILTPRLALITITPAMVLAEKNSDPRFAELVGCTVPKEWPPAKSREASATTCDLLVESDERTASTRNNSQIVRAAICEVNNPRIASNERQVLNVSGRDEKAITRVAKSVHVGNFGSLQRDRPGYTEASNPEVFSHFREPVRQGELSQVRSLPKILLVQCQPKLPEGNIGEEQ